MNERTLGEKQSTPENWSDVIGAVARKSDLDVSLQADTGLIALTTSDDIEVCPIFQFDKLEENLVINPYIAAAWGLFQSLQITQLKESPWTKIGVLTQPRSDFDGQSWADVLRSPETDDSVRFQIYTSIVGDAVYASQRLGEKLNDPRYALPE